MVIYVEFFLITFAIMSLSILLIHKLTQLVGFELKYSSLVLCAVMALIVNFAALTVSSSLTRNYFFLLLGLVLTSAALVTYYNAYLLRHEPTDLAAAPAMPAPADGKADDTDKEIQPVLSQSAVSEATAKLEPLPSLKASSQQDADGMPSYCSAITTKEAVAAKAPAIAKPSAEKTSVCMTGKKGTHHRRSAKSAVRHNCHPVALSPAPSPEKFYAPAVLVKTVAEIVHEDMENDRLLKLTAAIAKLGSLDDILDYAFNQKSRHNYSNAIFAYKRALTRYQDDDYAPFIIIELGNIYKENGAYEEAIHTYAHAFSLTAVKGNDAIRGEFTKSLAYLRIVEYILSQHNAPKTPFNKIPAEYLQEIEAAFQSRRKQKSVS